MKEHLINLLYEQFKFSCLIHQFNSIGIAFPQFKLNNNQIVLDIIGFPQDGIIESDKGHNYDTFHRDGLDTYLWSVIDRMVENEEVELTNKGLYISENYEKFVKGELAKYIDMSMKELDDPNKFEQVSPWDPDRNNLPLNLRAPRMNTVLYVNFDKYFNTSCRQKFTVNNPVTFPVEGDCIEFEWRDYLDNKEFIKELEKFDECDVWFCNILFKKYSKNGLEIHIVLMDSKAYKESMAK